MKRIDEVEEELVNIILKVIKDMNAGKLVKDTVKLYGDTIYIKGRYRIRLDKVGGIYVIGFGKASGSMAEAIEDILGENIIDGYVIIPKGTRGRYKTKRIKLLEGTHPLPSIENVEAARKIRELVDGLDSRDIVFTLISGGGSALFTLPYDDITVEDLSITTKLIMEAGADINELNAVRKHLSLVKGGGLARLIYPAKVYSLILSDVVGDPLDVIASGPTAPDTSTFEDAYDVLRRYDLTSRVPSRVLRHIEEGLRGLIPETPKPGDKIFRKVRNIIIGNNRMALNKVVKYSSESGYMSRILSSYIEGEAREVGKLLAGIALEIYHYNKPFKKPVLLVGGGETTVTVRGKGIGGRNLELVLSASIKIRGYRDIVIISVASDGKDGVSPAAGAYADGDTYFKAIRDGLKPIEYLENNDSYTFFRRVGGLIITGPTDTNINDITCIYVG